MDYFYCSSNTLEVVARRPPLLMTRACEGCSRGRKRYPTVTTLALQVSNTWCEFECCYHTIGWSYEHKHEHEQESAKASSSASVIKDWTHNHKAPPHAPTRHHYALVHHYGRVHARQGVQVGAESSVKWIRARGYLQASAAHAFASALLGRTCVRRTNVRYYAHVQHHFKSRGHLGWSASPGATYGG
jgi:hypothetical protein